MLRDVDFHGFAERLNVFPKIFSLTIAFHFADDLRKSGTVAAWHSLVQDLLREHFLITSALLLGKGKLCISRNCIRLVSV